MSLFGSLRTAGSLPVEGHSWLTQFLAYALLVVILWLLVRNLQSFRGATAAT